MISIKTFINYIQIYNVGLCQYSGASQDITQFANIAFVMPAAKTLHCRLSKLPGLIWRDAMDKRLGDSWNIITALGQRRQVNRKYIDPIK